MISLMFLTLSKYGLTVFLKLIMMDYLSCNCMCLYYSRNPAAMGILTTYSMTILPVRSGQNKHVIQFIIIHLHQSPQQIINLIFCKKLGAPNCHTPQGERSSIEKPCENQPAAPPLP